MAKNRRWMYIGMAALCLNGVTVQAEEEILGETEIQVFLAASLENAFQELIPLYEKTQPNVAVTYNADSSGTLMMQIREGYACDLFFSAARGQMDTLIQEGLVEEGTDIDLLENEVVVIAGKDHGTAVTGLADMGKAESIALAGGSVPVGKYTRQAMVNAGILDETEDAAAITTEEIMETLGTEISECSNVSKVKEAVKEGSCEVGTVYYTDAWSVLDDVDILEHVDKSLTGEIVYPLARIINEEADALQKEAAEDFYEFLLSEEAMKVFESYLYLPYNAS